MSTNLYVGNLTFQTNTSELQSLFSQYGEVTDAQVITDRETGRSRGFGFVEMGSSEAAQKAISALDGRDVNGRSLKVNIAKPRSR
ncbi:MAG TPA: RNA-binding protein [Acidimicrobiia bacterium]|jgi:RNA recognition motif-containing protein